MLYLTLPSHFPLVHVPSTYRCSSHKSRGHLERHALALVVQCYYTVLVLLLVIALLAMAEETPDMFAATEEWCIAPDAGLDADAALLGVD